MRPPAFRLERYFAQYEFHARYLLCCSDCESRTAGDILAMEPQASERLEQLWLGYTQSQGSPSLRDEIACLYPTIAPENILVHTGAEEAIFLFMHAALEPGDHIVVHWPCYQSLVEIARSLGCQVTLWEAKEETGWSLDLNFLKDAIRPETRAIVLNTPHNPTGFLMSAPDFLAVSRIAGESGILLFSDEVYRESEYDAQDRLPAACDLGEHGVSLGVISKTYGLPGLRIGWIATQNAPVYEKMAMLKDYTTICNSAPSELLAEVALRHRHDLARRNIEIILDNLAILDQFFSRNGDRFRWKRPKAGPIAFPRLAGLDVDRFCDDLVKNAGVLLLPGTVYDHPGNHFRIGFGRKNMPEALARLEAFMSASGL